MGLPKHSPNVASRGDMGWSSVLCKQRLEVVRLWCRLRNLPENRLTKRVFKWSFQRAGNNQKNWSHKVCNMFESLDLSYLNCTDNIDTKFTLDYCRNVLQESDRQLWSKCLWDDSHNVENGNKLRTYRTFKTNLECEQYLLTNIPRHQRRVMAMLRCGVLPIHVETGRYKQPKTPIHLRTCEMCQNNCIENEIHFFIDCPAYEDLRCQLFMKAQSVYPDFSYKSSPDKFVLLITCPELCFLSSKTLFLMYERRKHSSYTSGL